MSSCNGAKVLSNHTVSFELKSLYGGMSDAGTQVLAKLSSSASKKAKKFIVKYYSRAENLVENLVDTVDEITGGNNRRVVTSLNFVKDRKCEGATVDLFNSRAWLEDGVDVNGYHANGGDDTRLDCFRECVEYMSIHVEEDPDLTTIDCMVRETKMDAILLSI
jgi:type 1 glutamine amidotransferase